MDAIELRLAGAAAVGALALALLAAVATGLVGGAYVACRGFFVRSPLP